MADLVRAMDGDTLQEVCVALLRRASGLGGADASTIPEALEAMLAQTDVWNPIGYIRTAASRQEGRRAKREEAGCMHLGRWAAGLGPPRRVSGRTWRDLNESGSSLGVAPPRPRARCGSVLEQLERKEVLMVLEEELERLPPEERDLLQEVYGQGRTQAAIAKEWGVTPGSVRSRVDRVRRRLRAALERRLGIDLCPEN